MSDVRHTTDQPAAPEPAENQASHFGHFQPQAPDPVLAAADPLPLHAEAVDLGPLLPAPQHAPVQLPAPPRPIRIPHFGHVLLLLLLLLAGTFCAVILALVALHFHLFGISAPDEIERSMFYSIGIMGLLYLFASVPALVVFPLLWRRGILAGLQWSGASASRLRWRLFGLGVGCAGAALAVQSVLHLPRDTPIQQMLNSPQAAWLMFAFGVTVAPLCEEVLFRGFLLPSACTAFDWIREKITRSAPPELLPNDHPNWSLPAMVFGAAITSALFALLHASQTSNSKGVLLVLWTMGMVLSGIRLKTRSLAASTLTHASYNFTLFMMVLVATHGFRNLKP